MPRALLRPAEVAERLAVSRSWVYTAAADGRLPSVRLGAPDGPLRFDAADVEAWIEDARRELQPAEPTAESLRRIRDHAA